MLKMFTMMTLDSRNKRHFSTLVLALILSGCSQNEPEQSAVPQKLDLEKLRPEVVAFCGDCHAYPKPDVFPQSYWPKEVAAGYRFYQLSGRHDLKPPNFNDVVEYYSRLSPENLTYSPNEGTAGNSPVRFQQSVVSLPDNIPFPTVSFIRHKFAQDDRSGQLLFCDMNSGKVVRATSNGRQLKLSTLVETGFPAHVELCDLDQDGHEDLLIADLGSFMPEDHDRGRILWARWNTQSKTYDLTVLQDRLGRVADVKPIDFDSDGDLDLIVGEFGWRQTGRLLLLEHIIDEQGSHKFLVQVLDNRHGTSHVEVCDLNDDGAPDFVALISQEFEVVLAFINRGDGTFEKQTIFEAGDPSFGSTGIQVVDLDNDDDLDVLYTNGDMLDSGILKPSHGIHFLENRGVFPFQARRLTEMPGAYKALAGDLDADGDLDIVACALFDRPGFDANSLIWLEQQPGVTFVRHNLAGNDDHFCTLELGDFDGSGTIDIAVGNFYIKPTSNRNWLSFWWNSGKTDSSPE